MPAVSQSTRNSAHLSRRIPPLRNVMEVEGQQPCQGLVENQQRILEVGT